MNGLEDAYGDSIQFYRFNANDPDNQRLQNDLQLRGHPSVALVKANGDVSNRFFGSQPAELLRPVLDELINE